MTKNTPARALRRGWSSRAARLGLSAWAAATVLAASNLAWAGGGPSSEVIVALVLPAPAETRASVITTLFADRDQITQVELAAQRGGMSVAVPVASPQPVTPQITLWDELKGKVPSAPVGQGTNTMTIQIR